MNRTLSNLGPALFLAAAMLVASALVVVVPHAGWTGVAGLLLLTLALVGTDIIQRRRAGRHLLPSPSVLLVAASILAAGAIVASGDPDRLAGMIPILGSCAALPLILRDGGARQSCPPA